MLAVITSNSLATVEPSSLKRSQSPISPATVLSSPNAIAWAPDNSALYLADADGIHKFSPTGTLLETITRPDQSVSALAVKDKGNTLIYSQGARSQSLKPTQRGYVKPMLPTSKISYPWPYPRMPPSWQLPLPTRFTFTISHWHLILLSVVCPPELAISPLVVSISILAPDSS